MAADSGRSKVALLGWSLRAIDKFNREYVVVAPEWASDYTKRNGIPFIAWEFERLNDRFVELNEQLAERDVEVAVPLFEETVEWAEPPMPVSSTSLGSFPSPCSSGTRR